jgi:hypothetical protein
LAAWAGGVLEFVPSPPGPYRGGETVTVNVWLHNQDDVGHLLRGVLLDASLSAPTVYATGAFTTAGGLSATGIARWEGHGQVWEPLGAGLAAAPPLYPPAIGTALGFFDDGGGEKLYVGGYLTHAGGLIVRSVASWDGTQWAGLGGGIDQNKMVFSLGIFNDGTGPALYFGGLFDGAGGVSAKRIAQWDGISWSPLGTGMSGLVDDLTVFDDGNGPALYAGGQFSIAGGLTVNRIARWNGTAWSALGNGVNTWVNALAVFDDGSGPALYAGGDFTLAGGVSANYIARWDGVSWSPVGGGFNDRVRGLTVWDDGTGPALYAGGEFTLAGGTPANRIARWDGVAWTALASGMEGGFVYGMAGTERPPLLFACGTFTEAGGATANRVAAWDGATWSAMGTGMEGGSVRALAVRDDVDGTSPRLALAPDFQFDFSTLADGGASYFQETELPWAGFAYTGFDAVPGTMLYLPPAGWLHIGRLDIVLPSREGSYTLDLANAASPVVGAEVLFGFGLSPADPITSWRATAGQLTGGTLTFTVENCPNCQLYGDVFPTGGDCVVDVDDLGCVVAGFSDPSLCPDGDIAPCGGSGEIDVDDMLAVVDAFAGIYACPHPCPP